MGQVMAQNTAYMAEGIDIDASENCSASAVQIIEDDRLTIGEISCKGDLSIGTQVLNQEARCNNSETITAMATAAAQQMASAKDEFAGFGISTAGNSIDIQQRITMHLQARCDAEAFQKIKDESYQIGKITADNCTIFSQTLDQKWACVNAILAKAEETAKVSQTAVATAGVDLAQLLLYVCIGLGILAVCLVVASKLLGRKGPTVEDRAIAASADRASAAATLEAAARTTDFDVGGAARG